MTDEDAASPPAAIRRPLSSRNAGWAKSLAEKAVTAGFTPNQISRGSVGFAALGAVFLALAPLGPGLVQWLMLILAAGACQARLVCNLIDGMVAVEGGQATKDGPFWNDAPDRASDLLLLGGAGIAAANPTLGLLAVCLAIAAAYIRALGRAESQPEDFSGPMAKQHRMAALTVGCVVAAFSPFGYTAEGIMTLTLWIIIIGTGATIARRSLRLIAALKAG